MAKKTRAERHAEVIEDAIKEARAVAATDGAKELFQRSKGKMGHWTLADEKRLREGLILIPTDGPRPIEYWLQSAKKAKAIAKKSEAEGKEEEE